ncbi:hypothetical protein [Reticulibacter mediterranei]|uniref:hypothetical protein n=1 Tax=Reticulibacter mediterranei TaxID=2778369 RepID=UPI001C68CB88|nr:hypothetical protein [Reticulibacter mediterranei]
MDDKTPVSHIHWTSKVSCGYSVFAMLVFLIQLICNIVPYRPHSQLAPLYQILYLLQSLLLKIFLFMPLPPFFSSLFYLYLSAFIFAGIALTISSKRQWRKGKGMAIVGTILPGIILTLCGVLLVYLLFFWHPHFVW